MDKKEARKTALERRKTADVNTASLKVLKEIKDSGILKRFSTIGIYYPIGKEISILSLMELYPEKSFYLPITRGEIAFIPYHSGDILVDGSFKTKEPVGNAVSRDEIECFLVPCVGINKKNQRIGYGKGYYDRYLNGYKGYKIGICYQDSGNMDIDLENFDLYLNEKILG